MHVHHTGSLWKMFVPLVYFIRFATGVPFPLQSGDFFNPGFPDRFANL
jgi:hypothetical protein